MNLITVGINTQLAALLQDEANGYPITLHQFEEIHQAKAFAVEHSIHALIVVNEKLLNLCDCSLKVLITDQFDDISFFTSKFLENSEILLLPPSSSPDVIKSFYNYMTSPMEKATAALPLELIEKYKHSSMKILVNISNEIKDLGTSNQHQLLESIKQMAHKLAGSASLYGYPDVTRVCRSMENHLHLLLDDTDFKGFDADELSVLSDFLRQLQFAFMGLSLRSDLELATLQKKKSVSLEVQKPAHTSNPLIYLISEELPLALLFQDCLQQSQLNIQIESNAEDALTQLKSGAIHPAILVVDEQLPLSSTDPYSLVKAYQSHPENIHPQVTLIAAKDSLPDRIAALKQDIQYVLTKPLTRMQLLKFANKIVLEMRKTTFQVLILDDDKELTSVLGLWLKDLSIDYLVLNEEKGLIATLHRYQPNLLLLDVNLETFNGWSILESLRSDTTFDFLNIMIITGENYPETTEKAYSLGSDGLLIKPIEEKLFKLRISNLARRSASQGMRYKSDPITGFLLPEVFSPLLRTVLLQRGFEKRGIFLVIQMNEWDNLLAENAQDYMDLVLNSLREICQRSFKKSILIGFLTSSQIGLLFEDIRGTEVEEAIEDFFGEMKRKLRPFGREQFHLTLNAGVCLFRGRNEQVETVFSTAQIALEQAVASGSFTYQRISLSEGEFSEKSPEIIIADADELMNDVLKRVFMKGGHTVLAFKKGQEALNYFINLRTINRKMVLFIDPNLPDLNGYEIVKTVDQRFSQQVYSIILSYNASEGDIQYGYAKGAFDCVSKPCNTYHLLLKAEKLLRLT